MAFDLDPSYKQVPERIADFKEKHPEGCLQPVDPARPYWLETIDGRTFLVYAAAAYRSPDDPKPGIGIAWEPFPGKTPYTRESELQNAETSAWGRAIVAALASESKAVASAEDVRNRRADQESPDLACPFCGEVIEGARKDKEPMRAHLVEIHDYIRNDDGSVIKPKPAGEMGQASTASSEAGGLPPDLAAPAPLPADRPALGAVR